MALTTVGTIQMKAEDAVDGCVTQQMNLRVVTVSVFPGTGCVMVLMTVEIKAMKQRTADHDVPLFRPRAVLQTSPAPMEIVST